MRMISAFVCGSMMWNINVCGRRFGLICASVCGSMMWIICAFMCGRIMMMICAFLSL